MPDKNSELLPLEAISTIERYRMVRARIEHEDNLVTQRLNWFLASQSFLFTAYAINLNAPEALRNDMRHRILMAVVPLMAIAVAVLVFLGVMAGFVAMRHLNRWLYRGISEDDLKGVPPIQGFVNTRLLGMSAPIGLPPLFISVWICLMIVGKF